MDTIQAIGDACPFVLATTTERFRGSELPFRLVRAPAQDVRVSTKQHYCQRVMTSIFTCITESVLRLPETILWGEMPE